MGYIIPMNVIQLKYIGVGIFVSIIFITGMMHRNEQNVHAQKTDEPQVKQKLFFPDDTVSVPLSVSGVISATDAITVYTKTAGVIKSIFIEEGDRVKKGTVLFSQDTPVLDSSLMLAIAQGNREDTATLSQYSNQLAIGHKLRKTATFASTSAMLQKESYHGTTDELKESLRLTLDSSVTQLVTILDFLNENRRLLPSKAVDEYTRVLVAVYGSQPSYLNDGLVRRTSESGKILIDVQNLTEDSSIGHLVTVAEDVASQISRVSQILFDVESEFLDESKVKTESALYTVYLSHRREITDVKKNILTAQIGLIATLPQEEKNLLATNHAQIIAEIDEVEAYNQTKYAKQLIQDVSAVTDAQVTYIQSQIQLAQATTPFDAVVERVFLDAGQYAAPGESVAVLQGSGGLELTVSVPVEFVSLLKEGQAFTVGAEVVGHVSRFSPVTNNGIITVFITLDTGVYMPGQVLTGVLEIESENTTVVKIPREFIQFATYGPVVYTKDGKEVPITILYDTLKDVYIEKKNIFNEGITSVRVTTL